MGMGEYLSALWNYWIVLSLGGALAIAGAYFDMRTVKRRWPVFWRSWLLIVLIALIVAQTLAWFKVRDERDNYARNVDDEKAQAIREGRYYKPKASLNFYSRECKLKNLDERDLVEVSLIFSEYLIDTDNCTVPKSMGQGGHFTSPIVSTHVLKPREEISAIIWKDDFERRCHRGLPLIGGKITIKNAARIVECEALVHRAADRKPFKRPKYMFVHVEDNCRFEPIGNYYNYTEDKASGEYVREWSDAKIKKAFECLEKARKDPIFPSFDEMERDELSPVDEDRS